MEKGTAKRVQKRYRVLWDQNSGQAGYYNPPLSPERLHKDILVFLPDARWMRMLAPPGAMQAIRWHGQQR